MVISEPATTTCSRADPALVIEACRTGAVRFSVTVRHNPAIAVAIAGIDEQTWAPVPYWSSTETESAAETRTPHSPAPASRSPHGW